MEESMLITSIMKSVKKYLWLIIIIAAIGGIAGKFLASSGPAPTYEASSLVMVEKLNDQTNVIINQSDETVRFINTVQTFIKTSTILDPVIKELKLDKNAKDLASQITVTNENNSQLLKITVEDSDPKLATKIANKTAEVLDKKVNNYFKVKTAETVEKAQPGQENQLLHTRTKANIAMGVIIGLVIGFFLSLGLSSFSKK